MERINSLMVAIKNALEELAQLGCKDKCADDFATLSKDAKVVLEKNKAAEDAIRGISLGKVFRDEITLINQVIFDNFLPITKAAEKISERYAEKLDKETKEYPDMLKGRIAKIQGLLTKIVERVPDGFVDPASLAAINSALLPSIDNGIQKLNQHVDSMTTSIGESHSRIQMVATGLLAELESELDQRLACMGDLDATAAQVAALKAAIDEEKRKTRTFEGIIADLNKKIADAEKATDALKKKFEEEAGKNLSAKLQQFERELKDLLRFIEKNPRYQVLYAVNNSKSMKVSTLSSMLSIGEGIVKAIVEDLAVQGLVKISRKESDVLVEIVQALNPISCIASFSPEESRIIQAFTGPINSSLLETSFQSMKELIGRMRVVDVEKAGFLASLCYFKMHESRSFHWITAIRDTMNDLRLKSFYVRLVENMFSPPLHEKQKEYIYNNLREKPKLLIFSLDRKELVQGAPGYPVKGPFSIESIAGADISGTSVASGILPELNQFATIQEAVQFAWFSSNSGKLKVEFKDASGNTVSILVTDRALFEAEVVSVAHDTKGAS